MAASILLCGGVQAAETITYFHNDVYGTPVMATDAAGNLLWKESYLPYGDKLTRQPASAGNSIGFHGKALDDNTGLSYMGARYYDPVMGRFRSVDPVGVVPGNLHSFNRFTYANNNPYKYVDPDGRYAVVVARAMTFCAENPSCVAAGAAIAAAMGKAASTVLQSKASPPGGAGGDGAGGEAPPAAAPAAGSPGGADNAGKPAVPKPTPEAPYPNNPDNSDFDRINGGKGAKQNPEDGSVWERDKSQHGSREGDGDQWKRWPDKRSWERGDKPNSIWPDGRVRK